MDVSDAESRVLEPSNRSADRRPRPAARAAVAAVAGLVCALVVLTATGLLGGAVRAAADNGDGYRLYCGAGIRPATADGRSNWVGGAVVHFTRTEPCADPMPTSALLVLKAAAYGQRGTFELSRLGWVYALLAAAVTAAAAWAATAVRLQRAVTLLVPLAPLAHPDFARFLLSTYSEPTGLLAAYSVLCGAVVAATTTSRYRTGRLLALVLMAGGGAVAVTAKVAYAPVLLVAVLLCLGTGVHLVPGRRAGHRSWLMAVGGVVAAVVACAVAVGPVRAALDWQDRGYPAVNAHNVIFTMLLPEAGPQAAAEVGLPPGAVRAAGSGYFGPGGGNLDPDTIPGWQQAIGDEPRVAQRAAWRALIERPQVLLTATDVALQATRGADLDYLQSTPAPVGAAGPLQIIDSPSMGKDTAWLRSWLAGMGAPWWPSLLAALGVAAGVAGLRARPGVVAALTRVAGVASVAAVGMAVVAVVGDGYYELAKHMWLAAYLLDVTLLALVGVAAALAVRMLPWPAARSR